jgi:hypothetical protein
MRGTWVYRNGEMVEKHLAKFTDFLEKPSRHSDLPCPYIQSDSIEVRSMADGRVYDSKSGLRRSYKARGLVELGNDAPTEARPGKRPELGNVVKEAYRKVREGYKPNPAPLGELGTFNMAEAGADERRPTD